MAALSIVFMGTAELACVSLKALTLEPAFQVTAAVSQPDRPKGRDLKVRPSPVKALALALGLPVLQPERARNESFIQELSAFRPDLIVVAAYGQILPPAILALPRFGCLNVHTSLLPKYRGAAPIQWAILNDEPETGVTIMRMDAGLDTGEILAQRTTPIHPQDNAETLHDRLAGLGADLLVQTIPEFVAGHISPRPQDGTQATIARKIAKEDGQMDWQRPARSLWNQVRALTPWPGAFTSLPADFKPPLLKIQGAEIEPRFAGVPGIILCADKTGIVVACGEQALRILELQREGGRRLTAQQFLAGIPLKSGQQLGAGLP